ncbi:MAG: hypothetical protein U0800_07270 [Isosphaeraceae bacterium]
MRSTDDLEGRMAELRGAWPVGSMVDRVMARVRAEPARRGSRRGLFVGLSMSGLAAACLLAAFLIVNQPRTLLASVRESIERATSAHVTALSWDDRDVPHKFEIWYRRGEGLRVEAPDRVIVEDGRTQWSWSTAPAAGADGPVVLRQKGEGFFSSGLLSKLALPDIRGDWERFRTPEIDRDIDGRPCRDYTISLHDLENLPKGARAADGQEHRAQILAGADGRIERITLERRPGTGPWNRDREIRIEYDVPVEPEKVAARFPDGARVIDADQAFAGLYPIEKALHRVELGGLLLAVHDLQPLQDREGFYVVSSVRGTPEFLRQFPPKRRALNPEIRFLDVATQPMMNRNWGAKYDVVGLGEASREGVEYRWWAIVPRRFFERKDGRKEYLPESPDSAMPGEPGRLDDTPGMARIPLAATYLDDKHRNERGVPREVSTWASVPLPADRPPATWEAVAARARQDLIVMGTGGVGHLFGVAAGARPEGNSGRPLSTYLPDAIGDADFAAAVRRGLEDMREWDEVGIPDPEGLIPQLGGGVPK